MSIKVVRDQVFHFLRSDTPEVLAIKGQWGVGKTYAWKQLLADAQRSRGIALERYSYVSLFGINSLDAFKYSIFEHVIKREAIGTEADINSFKENASALLEEKSRRWLKFAKEAPLLKNFSATIESLSFLSLNKTVICIDDWERCGSGLSIKDALGLVTHLKEQKLCKIALILNDEKEMSGEYAKYREKTIDIEVQFSPTAEECADIAFEKGRPFADSLSDLSQKLGIRNIRVLKKIERLNGLVQPLLKPYDPGIAHQFAQSIVLFSWSYYCAEEGAPSLAFVLKQGSSYFGVDEEETNDENERWKSRIHDFGYMYTDDLDLLIVEGVKRGYFSEAEILEKVLTRHQQMLSSKGQESFSDTWRLYHDSFDDNADQVVSGLYESFRNNVKNITPRNLNGTVRLFRELGEASKATNLIDFYVHERKDEKDLFDLSRSDAFGDITDEEVQRKFKEVYEASVVTETALQVLRRIAGRRSWSGSDVLVLANTTVDEYFNLFKSERGDQLASYINTCLEFGRYVNANESQLAIASRVTEALRRIARESKLNALRVKKYGIVVDDTSKVAPVRDSNAD